MRDSKLKVLAARVLALEPHPTVGQRRNRQLLRVLGTEDVPVVRRLLDDAAFLVSERQMEVLVSQLGLRPRADTADIDVRVSVEPIENNGRTTRCRASRELVDAPAEETPLAVKLGLIPTDIVSPQEPKSLDRARGDLRMADREGDRFRH